MSKLTALLIAITAMSVPLASAQVDGALSDDVVFDAPNPFAENLNQQGITQEFSIGGSGGFANGDGEPEEDPLANPYASPDFDPNAEALFDPNADLNLYSEESFAESVEGAEASFRRKEAERKKALKEGRRPGEKPPEEGDLLLGGERSVAKLMVLKHACSSGGTIDRCMQRKALMPGFKDKGWVVRADGDGRYEVERVLLMNGTLPLSYRWVVTEDGEVQPSTIRAEMITEELF